MKTATKGKAKGLPADPVKFNCTAEERALVTKIVARMAKMAMEVQPYSTFDGNSAAIDLEAVHCNDTRMDFENLLKADDFNFAHDVFGIERKLDRKTGKLKDFFLPRCTERKKVAA